jgi:hypothetical protein
METLRKDNNTALWGEADSVEVTRIGRNRKDWDNWDFGAVNKIEKIIARQCETSVAQCERERVFEHLRLTEA